MKVGDRLLEKYTDLMCTVVLVADEHMLVKFDVTEFQFLIQARYYKQFKVVQED